MNDPRLDPRRREFDEQLWLAEGEARFRKADRRAAAVLLAVTLPIGAWIVWTAAHGRAAAWIGAAMLTAAVGYDLWLLLGARREYS